MIGVVFSTGMGPGQLEVSPDLNHSRLQFRSHIGFLYTCCCMVLLLPWKLRSLYLTHIKLFKYSQSAIKCRCTLWRNYSQLVYFDEVIPTCLGVRFFWNTVYFCTGNQRETCIAVGQLVCLWWTTEWSDNTTAQLTVIWAQWISSYSKI